MRNMIIIIMMMVMMIIIMMKSMILNTIWSMTNTTRRRNVRPTLTVGSLLFVSKGLECVFVGEAHLANIPNVVARTAQAKGTERVMPKHEDVPAATIWNYPGIKDVLAP